MTGTDATSTGIVWLRRDLRLRDHPALRAALAEHERVIPVFCFDDRLLGGRHRSGPRTQFLLECLGELAAGLRERGSNLVVRRGRPEVELAQLARATGARAIHFTSDVSPFARGRGELVHKALADAGVESHGHPGLFAVDDLARGAHQAGRVLHGLLPLPPQLARAGAPGRAGGAASAAAASVAACNGPAPVARVPRARAGGELTPGGRRVRGAARAGPLSRRSCRRLRRRPRRARARQHVASLPLPPLRLRHPPADRGAASPRPGRRGVPAPALLARLLPPRPAPPPPQRPLRVPGPLPRHDHVEPREAPLRGVGTGPDGLPPRRRRNAPTARPRAGCTTARGSSSAPS